MTQSDINTMFKEVGALTALNDLNHIKLTNKFANPVAIAGTLSSISASSLGYLIPLAAALAAGTYYASERELNEDSVELEKDKGKAVAYRTVTADVVRRLKDKGISDDQLKAMLS